MTANKAAFRVVVDGKDITPTLEGSIPGSSDRRRLVSLGLTEKRGDEADQLDLVIDDTDGRMAIPSAGAVITVAIGWAQGVGVPIGLENKGRFVVEEVDHSGPPDLITIRARAADFTSEIRTRQERSWHGTTLGSIVADLAKRNKLEARCAPALASIAVDSMAQSRESDVAFLRRLGRTHDAVAKIADGKLIFSPIGAGVTTSGKALPSRTITRSMGDRHSFKVQKAEEAGAVEATWHDRGAAERKTERVGEGKGKVRKLSRTYATPDAAQAAAGAEHRRAARQPVSLDLSLALSAGNVATGRYLRLPDVKAETGLGKTTIYQLIGEGAFPKPVKISSRAVAWREGAIEAWKADRQAQSE